MSFLHALDKVSIKYFCLVCVTGICAVTIMVLMGAKIRLKAKDFEIELIPQSEIQSYPVPKTNWKNKTIL